jgi:hypothetical protein
VAGFVFPGDRVDLVLTQQVVQADGQVKFNVYRDNGPDTYGSFVVEVQVKDAEGKLLEDFKSEQLSKVKGIVNHQNYETVKTGPYGITVPLAGNADLTLTPATPVTLTAGQPVTYSISAAYFVGYIALAADTDGIAANVLTVFPLTAPLVVPARSALVGVPLWEHLLAVVLVLVAIYAIVRLAGRVYGHLLALLTTLKGLPLAYNQDLQEDKEGLFDAVDTLLASLRIYAEMVRTLLLNEEAAARAARGGFMMATDLADWLARQGLPFRQAHQAVGKLVAYCVEQGKDLADLSLQELQSFSPLFREEALAVTTAEAAVAARNVYGGTAPDQVRERLAEARRLLDEDG